MARSERLDVRQPAKNAGRRVACIAPTRFCHADTSPPGDHSQILISLITQAVFETGPLGEVSKITPSWRAYTGQTIKDARGFGWLSAFHPGDLQAVIDLRVEAMRAGSEFSGEFRLRRADGDWCWTNIRAVPLRGSDGRIAKWAGMMIDISARHEAEARLAELQDDYRHAVDLNPQMLWTAHPDGSIRSVSGHWSAFTGQVDEPGAASMPAHYATRQDSPAALRDYMNSIASGDPLDTRFRVDTPGGERWIRARAWPRRDGEGRIVRWYGVCEDIDDAVLAEMERASAEERYQLVAEATRDIIWDFDAFTGVVRWNKAMITQFGHNLDGHGADLRWWARQIHPADRARVVARYSEIYSGTDRSDRWTSEYRFARSDGSYAHVLDRGRLIRDAAGTAIRAIGAMVDLSEKRRADDTLRIGEERLRLAVAASGLGISDYDVRTDTLHWSDELRQIIGVDADETASQASAHELIHPEDQAEAADHERRARAGDFGHQYRAVRRIARKNDGALRWLKTQGHPIYDRRGNVVRVLVTVKDVTEEKAAQDRVHWTATHDEVTRLLNRAAFQSELELAIASAAQVEGPVALLLIDLDNFKQINDSFGHHAGDLLLRSFGDRIADLLPPSGLLARFGGDEFAIILPGLTVDAAGSLADALLAEIHHEFVVDGSRIDVRASIGIAGVPGHAADAENLIKNADTALYAAKDAGRWTSRAFEPVMRQQVEEHASMLQQARIIIANAWIEPFYQPKIELGSGRVTGLEALFRWRHPVSGIHGPATIAHAFDEFELAGILGGVMVDAVLGDVRRWLDGGVEIGRVAINTSAAEFRNPFFAENMLARLAVHNVPPAAVELEITETAFLGDRNQLVSRALETLRAAGLTIALDDFGTGFSSLSHLQNFPVDTLKIDRSFVAGIEERSNDRAIVEVILGLGDALGLTIVAEGVETEAQASFLRGRGCTQAQGYLFAHPLPASLVADFIAAAAQKAPTR